MIIPSFGPDRMLALVGPYWTNLRGAPDVLIFSDDGHGPVIGGLRSGFRELGYNSFWGPTAPALVVGSSKDTFEVLYLTGRRQMLPPGWRPLAWSPDGRQILLFGHRSLALWSPRAPTRITVIGPVNRGYFVTSAEWRSSAVAGI